MFLKSANAHTFNPSLRNSKTREQDLTQEFQEMYQISTVSQTRMLIVKKDLSTNQLANIKMISIITKTMRT